MDVTVTVGSHYSRPYASLSHSLGHSVVSQSHWLKAMDGASVLSQIPGLQYQTMEKNM